MKATEVILSLQVWIQSAHLLYPTMHMICTIYTVYLFMLTTYVIVHLYVYIVNSHVKLYLKTQDYYNFGYKFFATL